MTDPPHDAGVSDKPPPTVSPSRALRVAVIGAGPAGIYAADALLRSGVPVAVDVFDRLPAPYGLVRYGVAPDQAKIKSVATVLRRVLERPEVRFFGNVKYGSATCGSDLRLADLRAHYHAVLYATGCGNPRRLGVPGEDHRGSYSAADFVAWYNGHPDNVSDFDTAVFGSPPFGPPSFAPTSSGTPAFGRGTRAAVVVGAGNVALDVARILITGASRLHHSDVPDPVLAALARSEIRDVYIVGRRGPAHAKFTVVELREFGKLAGVALKVTPEDVELDAAAEQAAEADRRVRSNVAMLRDWAKIPRTDADRRVHFLFWHRPVAILGDPVTSVQLETVPRPGDTGVTQRTLDAQLVLSAISYEGEPVAGLPFDPVTGAVPHVAGRVIGDDGAPMAGVYVAGWAKRGATGVIGTNRSDAAETVASIVADSAALDEPVADPDSIRQLLDERHVSYVTWEGWERLDAYELEQGKISGRERVKLTDRDAMLTIGRQWP